MSIHLRAVELQLNHKIILTDLNLELSEQRIGIIGANGSGKSTFARLLSGLIAPSQGEVLINGLSTIKERKALRYKISLILQNPEHQIILPVVEEDLAYGLKARGVAKQEIAAKVDEILSYYQLQAYRQHNTYSLSGGQKQLLAIAGVLINQPDILIFDEPTTLLDLRNKKLIQQVIHDLKQTCLVITHDLELLHHFERVLVFDEGRIVADDKPQAAIAYYKKLMEAV